MKGPKAFDLNILDSHLMFWGSIIKSKESLIPFRSITELEMGETDFHTTLCS